MSDAQGPLACHRCGAALAAPQDPRAVAAKCAYCGAETALPPHILEARRAELAAMDQERRVVEGRAAAQKLATGIITWTAVATIVPIVITIGVLVIVGIALGVAFYFAR